MTVEQSRSMAGFVIWFRRHFLLQPQAAAWLLAATLLMKLLVPAGFMPVADQGSITLELCSGFGPQQVSAANPHGAHGKHDAEPQHHGKQQAPCDFSVLAGPSLGGGQPIAMVEPVLFAPLPATILPQHIQFARTAHLRPPLRGPPIT